MNEWAKSEKQLEVLWKRSVCVCWGGGGLCSNRKLSIRILKEMSNMNLPGGPGVRTLAFSAGHESSIPGGRAKTPKDSQSRNQSIKQKQNCNTFNKDFKKWSTSKKKKT